MPKLTLRDLFAVVTIVALALGWAVDRTRLAVELQRAKLERASAELEQMQQILAEFSDRTNPSNKPNTANRASLTGEAGEP